MEVANETPPFGRGVTRVQRSLTPYRSTGFILSGMETAANQLTIGTVARNAGVGVETIRFYERRGLISKPRRRPSGYRQYEPDVIRRIRFIQRAKELGFSLREVSELLTLRSSRGGSCATVRTRALAKVEDVDARITALYEMRAALVRLSQECGRPGPVSACPFLDALDAENGNTRH